MRIAYLITAYRELQHLGRLHDALTEQDPGSIVHVQFDLGSPLASQARRLPYRVAFTRAPIRWGDGTYSRALVDSLHQLSSDPWDWVVFLSGQDYPVRPLEILHRELESGAHRAYAPIVGRSHSPDRAPEPLIERYMYRYRWFGARAPLFVRAAARELAGPVQALSGGRVRVQPRPRQGGPGVGMRRRATIFSEARPCWMGPDYVVMERSMASSVLDLLDDEPGILQYYDDTFVPSESLFTSAVRWIDQASVANRNFHFMRFGGRANPRRIEIDDLPELWDLGPIFARKFDDDSDWVRTRLPMRGRPG